MEGLEKILKNMDEKGLLDNNSHTITKPTMTYLIEGYDRYKAETDFWKLIRKVVYIYAIEIAVENHFLSVKEIVDFSDVKLNDEIEDKILKILLIDFFNDCIGRLGMAYAKSALAAFEKAADRGDGKMTISSAVKSFTIANACDLGLKDIVCNI